MTSKVVFLSIGLQGAIEIAQRWELKQRFFSQLGILARYEMPQQNASHIIVGYSARRAILGTILPNCSPEIHLD